MILGRQLRSACVQSLVLVPVVLAGLVSGTVAHADPVEAPPEQTDTLSAAMAARERGKPVRIDSKTTETSTVLANPDGTYTLEEAARPVRVK